MRYLLILCTLLSSFAATAQQGERNRFPKAILVQLSSEQNRMKDLQKRQSDSGKLAQLKKDAAMVCEKILLDFKDNFTMYPVYFFMDTNYEKIREGNFTDVLMDTDGDLMERTELSNGSTDFFIIYYGYPKFTKRKPKRIKASSDEAASFDAPTGKYFVICDNKLEQITYVRRGKNSFANEVPAEDKKYKYDSPLFNIGYNPTVKKLPGILTGLSLNYQ